MKHTEILKTGIILFTGGALLTGCATKKPYKVNASPIRTSQVAPMAREIQRTSPGEVMDPEAEVFAQVPKRIIFLPGQNSLTGRVSPEQVAAYSLVKVGQLPEVQAGQPTTVIMTDPSQNPDKGRKEIVNMTINERGITEEGTARVLNVMESTDVDKARGRIRPGETLKFIEYTGWVGWIPKGAFIPAPTQKIPEPLGEKKIEELLPKIDPAPTTEPTPPTPETPINLNPSKKAEGNPTTPLPPKLGTPKKP